jgi:Tol biopolymer transport system component
VFIRDLGVGRTERVSVATGGAAANGHSGAAQVSAGGRFVVFQSDATNLVPGDTNESQDIFVRDRRAGTTERVSVATGGAEANSLSSKPVISADGRFVAFVSGATNLAPPADATFQTNVFVRDRRTGRTTKVSVGTGGAAANGGSDQPAISADGRYVAFESRASNLVRRGRRRQGGRLRPRPPSRANRAGQCRVRGRGQQLRSPASRLTGAVSPFVSVGPSSAPAVDGIYVRDRRVGTTTLASVSSDGRRASSFLELARISGDGRYVVFGSDASDLVPGDTNGTFDAFLRDLRAGRTTRISVSTRGRQANGESVAQSISADGMRIGFSSTATNLVARDTNGVTDVFVRTR